MADWSEKKLPERVERAGEEDLSVTMARDAEVQKKVAEKLRKNPIDPKKYKGRVQKIEFSEAETQKKP